MNLQEREQLSNFLNQLERASVPEKVAEAEAMIHQAVTRQPDAAYLLVQRSLLLEQALNAAKSQIATLQRQLQESKDGFLTANPWTQPEQTTQLPGAVPGAQNYQMPRSATANAAVNPVGQSFLGSVASTAAGVVAGSFLFQGLESLLGHHSPLGGSGTEPFNDHPTEQTVINNYYGSESQSDWNSEDSSDPFLSSDDSFSSDDSDDSTWV